GQNGYVHQLPGRTRYPNLILSHGLTDLETLWNWYDSTARGVIQRRNMTIMVLDRRMLPAMWWDIREAYPVKWHGPTFNAAEAGQVAVESVEIVHRGIQKPALSQALSAARGLGQLAF